MSESEKLIEMLEFNKKLQSDEITEKIYGLLELTQQCAKNEAKRVTDLINNDVIKSDLVARKIRRRLTGERYSIFDALGRSDSETSHSLFLRHLLDPMETHDQGTIFLDCLIHKLKSLAKEQVGDIFEGWPDNWRDAKSRTEVVHKDGRIDIVIELPHKACIVIENKVWASEQYRQMARYGEWLESQKNYKHKLLIFLTPNGQPSKTRERFDVINISYDQLAQALTTALNRVEPTAIPVQSVVKQYIDVCNYIYTGSKPMTHANKEIIELLKTPTNFEIALDIKAYIEEIDLEIRRDFIKNVAILLNKKINSNNSHRKWIASGVDYWGVANTISIETDLSGYKVIYGNLFHEKPWERQFGWHHKDKKIDHTIESVKNLVRDMSADYPAADTNCWLCCVVGENQKIQIPTMDMSWNDPKTKLAMLKDNQKDHLQDCTTFANSLANAMWDIFSKFRADVENLPTFQS